MQRVTAAMCRPKTGSWNWSPSYPRPKWSAVSSAPIWRAPEFGPIRLALAHPPAEVNVFGTGSGRVAQLEVDGVTVSMYEANEGAIPEEMLSCVFTGMLVVADSTGSVRPQVLAGLGHASLLVYGTVGPEQLSVSSSHTPV